jgi:outer membrane protein TolC
MHEALVPKAAAIVEQTRKRFDKGLLTKLEMLNVESQMNQILFQKATAENDYALARLKFLQRLKLSDKAIINIPSEFPPSPPQEISIEEAMQAAARHRPDIQINSLLVQFNEFEQHIVEAKSNLKVDLSTFLGYSGAAFETEQIQLGTDYSFGVKATKAWGPHETSFSATKTKTSPRLGQSSVTDNTVYEGQIAFLNQHPARSELQQAKLGLARARQDFDDTKANVMQEVEEAYVSYAKAKIQLFYAEQKLNFRMEQLKIFQAQAELNEALPSQILGGISGLNDEYVSKMNALMNYHVALARLSKAIGLSGRYK